MAGYGEFARREVTAGMGYRDGNGNPHGGRPPVSLAAPVGGVRLFAPRFAVLLATTLSVVLSLGGCGGGGDGKAEGPGTESEATATGAALPPVPSVVPQVVSDAPDAVGEGTAIDMSHAGDGFIVAQAVQPARLKLTVTHGEMTYPYDLPGDGTPIAVPVNMGDGLYQVAIMLNVEGNNYVEILSAQREVTLVSEFAPFLVPNMFCVYSDASQCVREARTIAGRCSNQGELAAGICEYVMGRLEYDTEKARACANATGYVPNPDASIGEGRGICFDYASLGVAMFRSTGIPARLVTGYILPERTYHSWIEAYVDGRWHKYGMSVESGRWSLLDVTLADEAAGDESLVPTESEYEVRFVY